MNKTDNSESYLGTQAGSLVLPSVLFHARGGHSLVSSVPMRDQRIVEHTLNSVIDILNLTPLFTVFALKCDPFHCVPSKSTPFHCSQLKHWNAIILL